jgi:outer membrane lipoprotein-sorting protein
MNKDLENKLDQYINNLNEEKKPQYDDELSEMFETVRAVKSLKNPQTINKGVSNKVKSKSIFRKIITVAAMLIFVVTGFLYFSSDDNINIANAMMEAYNSITGYQGSLRFAHTINGNTTEQEIDIIYQKDNMFYTVTKTNGNKFTRIYDGGDKMISFHGDDPQTVIIDYMDETSVSFYLQDYNLADYVYQMQHAIDVERLESTTFLGQNVDIYQYRFDSDQPLSKVWLNEVNLPLKIESNYENSVLIREFLEFEVNPNVDQSIFKYEIKPNQEIHYTSEKPEEEEPSFDVDHTSAIGYYIGQIDNNHIEVNLIDAGLHVKSFRTEETLRDTVESLEENTLVNISFEVSGGIATVTSVTAIDNATITGYYLGDADTNFSEFMISDEIIMIAITEKARNFLYENNITDEQLILTLEKSSISSFGIVTDINIAD